MITEEMYLLAKKIVDSHEQELNKVKSVAKEMQLKPVEIKEVGKRYYWNRHPISGKSGNVTIMGEGGSHRAKGWQVLYGDEKDGTKFAKDEELFEALAE